MKLSRQSLPLPFLLLLISLSGPLSGCSQPSGPEQNQQENQTPGGWNPTDPPAKPRETYPLLLIGLDGFRPDYFDETYGASPNFNRLITGGTKAKSLKPVFPTKTFVNIYSIATGLYAENHGIVGNTVYDPERDEYLRMSDAQAVAQSHWWGGEPIWVTAERQDVKTGTYIWVGSEAEIKGYRPSISVPFAEASLNEKERVDQVVDWLTGDDPVQFATLYFSNADNAGHRNGPLSPQVAEAVQLLDHTLGYLIDQLDEAGIWPDINLLIVSDHGMVQLDKEKRIMIDELIPLRDVNIIEWSPVAMLTPKRGKSQQIFEKLDAPNPYREHYQLYRKEDVPKELHLSEHDRIPEIILIADMPYTIANQSFDDGNHGGHGYSPEYPEMHGIFLAHGPDFKENHTTDTLQLVDLYELMTYLLDIEAAPNDGDLTRIGPEVLKTQ